MKLILGLLFATGLAFGQDSNHDRLSRITELRRFAFGSCNKTTRAQPLWTDMMLRGPQLFLWGGDNVYADSGDTDEIRIEYQKQNDVPEYKLFKSMVPIIGTWDDHDYGQNNGNGNFAAKVKSQKLALDFFEEPPLSPRRLQEGIYTSYTFGQGKKKVKFILLDNRFFKDLEPEAPFLGSKQWRWLEEQLTGSDASLHFVVSGLSILSPPNPASEEWIDYPKELSRLRELVKKTAPKGLLFLTGDKHFSTVLSRYGLIEFMSSGMTHNTHLPLRPWVWARYPKPLFKKNYGLVDIEWVRDEQEETLPVVTVHFRTADGDVRNLNRFRWTKEGWERLSSDVHGSDLALQR